MWHLPFGKRCSFPILSNWRGEKGFLIAYVSLNFLQPLFPQMFPPNLYRGRLHGMGLPFSCLNWLFCASLLSVSRWTKPVLLVWQGIWVRLFTCWSTLTALSQERLCRPVCLCFLLLALYILVLCPPSPTLSLPLCLQSTQSVSRCFLVTPKKLS